MSAEFNRPLQWLTRRRSQIRAEVDEELRFHLEARVAELRARGLSEAAARDEAMRQFGDLDNTLEVCVESDERRESSVGRRRYFDELGHDVMHGLRQMRRRWPITVLTALTLGVGTGAATAIAGAADHVLFRPLPYANSDRVVTLWETDEESGTRRLEVSPGNFLDWKSRSTSFSSMGLAEPFSFDIETEGRPQSIVTWRITDGWFESLGVQPITGRLFTADDYTNSTSADDPAAILISEALWNREFAGDPGVIGRTLLLNGQATTVVGVIPDDVKYPEPTDIWSPLIFQDEQLADRVTGYMRAVGRLAPGVSFARAQSELAAIAGRMQLEYPATNRVIGSNLIPLEEQILGRIRPALLVLLGAVGFLLLIACANVASLLLASGAERSRELAVRAALGAGRRRLVHQLAAESLLLALLGGAVGIVIARFGMQVLVALSPDDLPRIEHIGLDGRVLLVALAITLLTAMLFGLAPALRFSRPDLLSPLRAGGRSMSPGRDRHRLRGMLVAGEVALALMLLIGAGLLMRSFVRLLDNDLGFETQNRATLQVFLWDRNPGPQRLLDGAASIEEALRSTPGVIDVGIVSALPFHPHAIDAQTRLRVEGVAVPDTELPTVYATIVSPAYFRTMGIGQREGRAFDDRDRSDSPRVVIINEALARQYFPAENPIGRRITAGAMSRPESREIIGIVNDVRPVALDSDVRPEMYVPLAQVPNGSLTFVVHTQRDAGAMLPTLRDRLWSVDPGQSIYWSATVEQLVSVTLAERRFQLVMLGLFSTIALVLSAIGLYGLVSYMTQQRTSEIGVRMALGADRQRITMMIVAQGLTLAVPGVLAGTIGALALTRLLRSMLYNVEPTDPATFVQIGALMLIVAGVASWVPAWRAVKQDPLRAIQKE